MKRLFYVLFSFLFSLIIIISPLKILASDGYSEVETKAEITEKNESAETAGEVLSLNAPSCILMDENTGKVLFEKNPDERRPCASITKVMTLILTFEAIEEGKFTYSDMLTASAHASSMGGSDIWLKEGESMSVDDLIKATVVMSANDAAVVLAEAVAGSEEAFVIMMNEKAKSLGMNNTTFKNCNGLDEDGHLTTARDVAIMSCELLKHEKIFDYTNIWIDYVRDGQTQLVNTNKLIKSYKGITGLKTGTTGQAKSCIAASAMRDKLSLVAVVLGADSTDYRFKDAAALLNFGFANYKITSPEVPLIENVSVFSGMKKDVPLKIVGTPEILVSNNEQSEIKCEVKLNENIEAPIKAGDKLGEIIYTLNKNEVCRLPVEAADSVERISFKAVFMKMLEVFFTPQRK